MFGAGPHLCIGEQYAVMNTALVLANAAVMIDFEHVRTPQSEQTECVPPSLCAYGANADGLRCRMIATIFPKDGCWLKMKPRTA